MFIPTKEVWHRHKLDDAYLNVQRPHMAGCPICGRKDGLKYSINPTWNFGIECLYRIRCDACGYEPEEWYDTIADATLAFDTEARYKLYNSQEI